MLLTGPWSAESEKSTTDVVQRGHIKYRLKIKSKPERFLTATQRPFDWLILTRQRYGFAVRAAHSMLSYSRRFISGTRERVRRVKCRMIPDIGAESRSTLSHAFTGQPHNHAANRKRCSTCPSRSRTAERRRTTTLSPASSSSTRSPAAG